MGNKELNEDTEWKEDDGKTPIWEYLKPGDKIQGVWVRTEENVGENNSNIYVLRQEDGSEIGFWGSTILDDRMSRHKIGEEVRVEYTGKKKSKTGGREYHTFKTAFRMVPFVEEGEEEEVPM